MMMASILGSQGVVFATAMAVSGTVILLALRLQKSLPAASAHLQFPVIAQIIDPQSSQRALRSCISSDDGKRRSEKKKKTKKKKVHFAKDVVDPIGYSEEFRRKHGIITSNPISTNNSPSTTSLSASDSSPNLKKIDRGMPANRMALYNGILRDRVVHRLACSY